MQINPNSRALPGFHNWECIELCNFGGSMRVTQLAGHDVPVIGQGTWHMAEQRDLRKHEVAALRQGLEAGMSLIDTAEMYADGGAEEIIGEAMAGIRDQVFLVSKVYPHNASRQNLAKACERSLRRLRTDHIELYLLHWPGQHPLEETVEAFERLREAGRIGAWGVSNFDMDDMQELTRITASTSSACATNQVLYNPSQRGIEFDLLPWGRQQSMPIMAYSPVGQGGRLLKDPVLQDIANRHQATTAQVCLAWACRQPGVIAIPKAVDPLHVAQNASAVDLQLSEADHAAIDAAFAPPQRKQRLAVL
jgi:diketogulonate reductase-like aldo/keto reductase